KHGDFDRAFPLATFGRIMGELSSAMVAVSQSVRQDMAGWLDPEGITGIYNGVDVPREAKLRLRSRRALFGLEDHAPTLLFVGSLTVGKGVLFLPDLLQEVRRFFPRAHCVLVGDDGGARDVLMERIALYGLDDAFRVLGARSDVAAIMSACDLLVLPSWLD